jgi:transcriptional regulator with XRE-family HTH domain
MAKTRDFSQVIRKQLAENSELAALVEEESFNADVATEIYEARKNAGLTQRQLAEKIGTHQSVIARLEGSDYDGQSLAMLKRIAKALGKRLRVGFYSEFNVPVSFSKTQLTTSWTREQTWKPIFNTESSITAR